MQAGVSLLVSDVMPIYMIIPRYYHNYAQFCQLLNSNSFTHRKILMLLREATSEIYGPWVYLHHINLPSLYYCFAFLLCLFLFFFLIFFFFLLFFFMLFIFNYTLHYNSKNTKNILYPPRSDLSLVS